MISFDRLCDLHTHSNFSDGSCSPEELVDLACQLGLGAVALCDHNTVAGLPRFRAAARDRDLVAVPGVEVTAQYLGKEVHILGLFVPEAAEPALTGYLGEILRRKRQSNKDLIARLQAGGYGITPELVQQLAVNGTPNRVHMAKALEQMGYVASIKEAFDQLLGEGGGYYVPPEKLGALEVIGVLRRHGALPLLAHPLLNLNLEQLETFLPLAKAKGLVGLEALYPKFTTQERETLGALARRHGLAVSGGSDFHGENRPGVFLGRGRNNLEVPLELLEGLQALTDC